LPGRIGAGSRRFSEKFERFLLTLSDKVVVVDDTRKSCAARYRPQRKGRVVRNVPLEDVNEDDEAVRAVWSGELLRASVGDPWRRHAACCRSTRRGEARCYRAHSDPDLRKRVEVNAAVDRYARMSHRDAMRRMKGADLVALLYDPRSDSEPLCGADKFYEAIDAWAAGDRLRWDAGGGLGT